MLVSCTLDRLGSDNSTKPYKFGFCSNDVLTNNLSLASVRPSLIRLTGPARASDSLIDRITDISLSAIYASISD